MKKKRICGDVDHGILVIKKNEILPFAAIWMDPENITLSGVSQTKTNIILLTCGI